MRTDTVLPTDDEIAGILLARHHVATAVHELAANKTLPPATVAVELLAHAIIVHTPMVPLEQAREWSLTFFFEITEGIAKQISALRQQE